MQLTVTPKCQLRCHSGNFNEMEAFMAEMELKVNWWHQRTGHLIIYIYRNYIITCPVESRRFQPSTAPRFHSLVAVPVETSLTLQVDSSQAPSAPFAIGRRCADCELDSSEGVKRNEP